MAKLSTKARDKLPAKDFAGPNRSFPVENASHARNAKARASEMEHRGRISPATESKIDRKADRVMDKHKGGKADRKPMHEQMSMGKAVKALEANHKGFEKGHGKGCKK